MAQAAENRTMLQRFDTEVQRTLSHPFQLPDVTELLEFAGTHLDQACFAGIVELLGTASENERMETMPVILARFLTLLASFAK